MADDCFALLTVFACERNSIPTLSLNLDEIVDRLTTHSAALKKHPPFAVDSPDERLCTNITCWNTVRLIRVFDLSSQHRRFFSSVRRLATIFHIKQKSSARQSISSVL